jgi:NAD(P) transhydrogenase subunit alpha
MQIGFVKTATDPRCPVSDGIIKKYVALGCSVSIENGLGSSVHQSFDALENVHEESRENVLRNADLIYAHTPLHPTDLDKVKEGAVLVSFYAPFNETNDLSTLEGRPMQAFSMDMIPRTTLAQSMDVLSSMASIAGYKAVLLAAEQLPRYFPMMMTAAGTIKPATVVILGAGVAGLQAIATAKRLGAIVEVFDVRHAVKEEVQSLGGRFIEVEGSSDDKDAGGYAVEQTEDYKRRQQEKVNERVQRADVVITTAQLRGKRAPTLVTREMVESMKHGSVIIDMASSTGGNCELSKNEETVIHNGVKIIGDSNLDRSALIDASEMLANNIHNYVSLFIKEGSIVIDEENEIISKSRVYSPQKND